MTGDLLPGALAPGIYVEDEATYQEILSKGDARLDYASLARPEEDRPCGWFAHTIGGIRIRVATPMELVVLRGVKRTEPVEEPYSLEEVGAKVKALMALMEARASKDDTPIQRPPARRLVKERLGPAVEHPFRGANRAARRAAASRARP